MAGCTYLHQFTNIRKINNILELAHNHSVFEPSKAQSYPPQIYIYIALFDPNGLHFQLPKVVNNGYGNKFSLIGHRL